MFRSSDSMLSSGGLRDIPVRSSVRWLAPAAWDAGREGTRGVRPGGGPTAGTAPWARQRTGTNDDTVNFR